MKTLEDLTPEMEAMIPVYLERYTDGIYDGKRFHNFNRQDAVELAEWNYKLCDKPLPFVIVAENPFEAQVYYNFMAKNEAIFRPLMEANVDLIAGKKVKNKEALLNLDVEYNPIFEQIYNQLVTGLGLEPLKLDKTKKTGYKFRVDDLSSYNNDYLFTMNIYANALLAFYMFLKDEGGVECDIPETLDAWNHYYMKSGVYSTITAELICIVTKYPKTIHINANNDLHCTYESSVIWNNTLPETKFENFFVNGRTTNKELFNKVVNNQLSLNEFIELTNEEDKAMVITMLKENGGNEAVLSFLGANLVDSKVIKHTEHYSETIELYKSKDKYSWANDSKGDSNVQLAWLKIVCPSTNQIYLINSCPTFNNVIDAAKFHRPERIPSSVDYIWTSAN